MTAREDYRELLRNRVREMVRLNERRRPLRKYRLEDKR